MSSLLREKLTKIDSFGRVYIVDGEGVTGQGPMEIPGAPECRYRRSSAQSRDLGPRHRLEGPLQHQEVDVVMAKGKVEEVSKGVAGPISRVGDGPRPFPAVARARSCSTSTVTSSGNRSWVSESSVSVSSKRPRPEALPRHRNKPMRVLGNAPASPRTGVPDKLSHGCAPRGGHGR